MLDREISVTKCHIYLFEKIITNHNIGKLVSILNFADAPAKLESKFTYRYN